MLVDLVAGLPLAKADKLPDDVALEAFNLAAAFIDADGRHTDEELSAFIGVFAARFDTVARAGSPPALRAAGLLAGKRTFLDTPVAPVRRAGPGPTAGRQRPLLALLPGRRSRSPTPSSPSTTTRPTPS